jgi:putative beta-lysine N-acetyltransferase
MAVEMKNSNLLARDQWQIIKGRDFNCHILVSPFNRRITVYEFDLNKAYGAAEMIRALVEKAGALGLDKIWLKSGVRWKQAFLQAGMKLEASIPGYYKGGEPALVLAIYLSTRRQTPSNSRGADQAEELISCFKTRSSIRALPAGITLQWGQPEHCLVLARLYGRVFSTYPFPVADPDYLKLTMDKGARYIMAWRHEELVAAASAEINRTHKNAEMTDFATISKWRGYGLANCLLTQMEARLEIEGLRCLYTIARSSSIGMNKVFAGAGYGFNGVLINNCNISGGFEDMNVWSKCLYNEG